MWLGSFTCDDGSTPDLYGNCADGTNVNTNPGTPTGLCTSAACQMTGTPLITNPLTGQPSSTLTVAANTLSNNSTLIVAACAILGLLVAMRKK